VDNDGYEDILIPAVGADGSQNSRTAAGELYVIYGRERSAWPSVIDACMQINCANPASKVSGSGAPDITIFAADAINSNACGGDAPFMITSGDVNNDGYDDILFTTFGADSLNNGRPAAGETYVIFGRERSVLPAAIDACMPNNYADPSAKVPGSGAPDILIFGADADPQEAQTGCPQPGSSQVQGDQMWFIQSGDVNGDGFDDILPGAFRADGPNNTRKNAGEIYIIFGK